MAKIDQFLVFINTQLKTHLEKRGISGLEKIAIKVSIYDIFQANYDLEKTYYEVLEYMEEKQEVKDLAPSVTEYFKEISKK